jgi:hypothetical protein
MQKKSGRKAALFISICAMPKPCPSLRQSGKTHRQTSMRNIDRGPLVWTAG